jgi:hypothetical protein
VSEVDHGHDLGVDWVDVSAEPHHVEQFCIHGLRVFEVTIEPGTSTQFHRHHRDTIYVRTTTGRSRAEEPGHQPTKASLGRSTGLTTRLRLLASRKLSQGWLEIPAGTVILQPHHSLPLIHRVTAHQSNPRALRMIGVELQRDYRKPQPFPETRQLLAECPAREWWPVYRLRVSPHGHATLSLPGGGALIVVCGTALLVGAQDSVIESSQAHWLAPGIATVHASGPQALDAVLVPT